jgi:RimJ/RimL family protein N-acetyltransferase
MIRTEPFSDADIARLWEIERDPLVSKKMPGKIKNQEDLEEWLSENIVYGICNLENQIIGFVQLYEMGDGLIKRLPIKNTKNLYEISFALPEKYRYTTGLVSSAVRDVCAIYPKFQIVAFTHPDNLKSIRVLEKSGFTYLSKTKYHGNDRHENLVYIKVIPELSTRTAEVSETA